MNDEQNISASNASTDKPEAQPINDLQAAEKNSKLLDENPVTQESGHKETIEPVEPDTIIPKQQTKEMEVHHHGQVKALLQFLTSLGKRKQKYLI